MTDEQKQIIEIVEPYMAKDLSEGCLVNFMGEPVSFITKDKDEDGDDVYILNVGSRCEIGICPTIIGHYDITAVLKYIEDIRYNTLHRGNRDYANPRFDIVIYKDTWYIESNCEEMGDFVDKIEFKLKPLHLYIEQEEKDLLELLKQLGHH